MSSTFHYGDTEAEQKKHLLLKSIAPLGSASVFTYDAFGNPLTSQVQNADANPSYFIRGETTYTDDGNYVTEQKDARGKIVRTEIDPERGTTTSVTDAKGQTVEYKYDELRRIVKTSASVGAKEGILSAHNEYTYDTQWGIWSKSVTIRTGMPRTTWCTASSRTRWVVRRRSRSEIRPRER